MTTQIHNHPFLTALQNYVFLNNVINNSYFVFFHEAPIILRQTRNASTKDQRAEARLAAGTEGKRKVEALKTNGVMLQEKLQQRKA